MTIMKYILFALLLFGLWVTEPLWWHTDALPVDKPSVDQKETIVEVVNLEEKYWQELEVKFGPKPAVKSDTGVPLSVYKYWDKTLPYPDSLQKERCGLVRGSDEGWTTVCSYRTKNRSGSLEIREEKYIIKNGTVYK